MSSPTIDLGAILTSLANALVTGVTTLVNVIAENIGLFVELGILGAVIYGVIRYGRRFFSELVGWTRRLIPF